MKVNYSIVNLLSDLCACLVNMTVDRSRNLVPQLCKIFVNVVLEYLAYAAGIRRARSVYANRLQDI